MITRQKRGQAAMEFLMTYGWAILAAIIAIGVLAYFGVFSPGKLAGSSAILNNPFYVKTWQVTTAPAVNLEVINNGGSTITVPISNFTVTGTGSSAGITCTNAAASTINPGQQVTVTMTCVGGTLVAGDAFAADMNVVYTQQGSTLTQTTTGRIRANVQ